MDFGNERYVRLYVRETTTFRLLCFEAQALLPQLLRLVDRSGVLDLGGVSAVEAIAAALPKWPVEVVERGLADLLQRDVLQLHGDVLLWPKFLEAQDAARSDRQRARESRARRREAVTKRDGHVTKHDAAVTNRDANVTVGHTESHAVTPATPRNATLRNAETDSASSKRPASPASGNGEDSTKDLFDRGVQLLTETGVQEKPARSLIGKLRKHHGDAETMNLIRQAESKTAPSEWLAATLRDPSELPYVPMGRK